MTAPAPSTPPRSRGMAALVGWMAPRRRRQLALLFVLMLAGAVAELVAIGAVLPFMRLVVAPDALLADPRLAELRAAFGWRRGADLVVPAAALLVACTGVAAAVRLLLAWASQRFVYRLGFDLDAALFRRTVHQPYRAYVERNGSEILAGFDKINVLANTVLLPVMTGIASAVIAMFIVALLFVIDPLAAAVTTASMGLVYAGIGLVSRRTLRLASRERARLATGRIQTVREALGGLRDVILDRSHAFHEQRFATINDRFRDLGARTALIATTPRFVVEAAAIVLIGGLAVHLAGRPGGILAALPVLGALVLGGQRLLPLLQSSYFAAVQYLAARRSLDDVLALMDGPVRAPAPAGGGAAPPFARSIALADAGVDYAGGVVALAGIELSIARGERIGLVGPTGSGKSTLADVLMGLIAPDTGAVLLDGVPLTPDRVADWQAQIAHVPQHIFLADDTILANIVLGAPVDPARVEDAARRAQLHDFVVGLTDGYATMVGERGIRLSGGQRQRIGIARALYKRADVLVLDEATSALDDATEAAVMAAIDGSSRTLTIVMIAHRLSTLERCDVIYGLDRGRLVHRGAPAALPGRDGG